jgi:hypothetical protein
MEKKLELLAIAFPTSNSSRSNEDILVPEKSGSVPTVEYSSVKEYTYFITKVLSRVGEDARIYNPILLQDE